MTTQAISSTREGRLAGWACVLYISQVKYILSLAINDIRNL